MMILRRYIASHIIGATLIVLCVLLGMDLFVNFLNEIDDLGQGYYTISQALMVAFLRLPQSAYQFFPVAGLVGSLLGLGVLASHSELIVMRAAGVSIGQIIRAVMWGACLIMLIVTILGEVIAPKSMQLADEHKAMAIAGGQVIKTMQGVWIRDGNTFIYVNVITGNHHLQDINWYTLDNQHQLRTAGFAQSGDFSEHQWHLHQVAISEFNGSQSVHSEKLPDMIWNISLKPRVLMLTQALPGEMSLLKLYRYIDYRRANNMQSGDYQLMFWQRLLQPFATMVMIFLAIPFIFGPLRSVTMGLRMVIGIVAGFCFYLINQVFGPLSMVYQLPPLWSAALPVIVFSVLGFVLLFRTI